MKAGKGLRWWSCGNSFCFPILNKADSWLESIALLILVEPFLRFSLVTTLDMAL